MKFRRLFVAALILLSVGTMMAQMPQIPQDPNVKIGHLDNGLTYYIRHNALPEGKASFYIVHKVGSLQEEESQRGLAHLLEHMAFNGSEHFKGNGIFEFLNSIGAQSNASTSIDNTEYYVLNAPTRTGVIDSCMLILKDWCNGITLSVKSIDDERDVVHNEYRMRIVGSNKIIEKLLPEVYPNSKYGQRFIIGLMSVIDGCTPDVLRAYYRKWYRPDNQALIIVGDIDVDKIETKIKELFAGIQVPADAAKVIPEIVPDNKDAIYAIGKDKAVPADNIFVFMKRNPTPSADKQSAGYLMQKYIDYAITYMLDERYAEKVQDSQGPFLSAASDNGVYLYSNTKDAFCIQFVPRADRDVEAYEAALAEAKRAADSGFTATECQRAQDAYMSLMDKEYANRDKMHNNEFPQKYVDNFLKDEPIPSVEQEYQLMKTLIPQVSLEMINQRAKELINLNDSNFVTVVFLQEKDGDKYPVAKQFADAKAKVLATHLEAYVDKVKQKPLIAQTPKAGHIVKTTENKALGYKTLFLSNGAKVILKKTDFKDSEVRFHAWAKGGISSYPQSKAAEILLLSQAANYCGRGNFSSAELQKALVGKQVQVDVKLEDYARLLSGYSTPKDLETLMQLIHLSMTSITKDEKSFENFRQMCISVLANQSNDPDYVYEDSLESTIHLGSKFSRIPTADDVKAFNCGEMVGMLRDMYSNAKDFTFSFVGNFDEQTIIPLVNTYLASLPNSGKVMRDKEFPLFKGNIRKVFTKSMDNPSSRNSEIWYSDAMMPSERYSYLASVAGYMLYMSYFNTLREKLSSTYNPEASIEPEYTFDGKVRYKMTGKATLNPDKIDVALPYFIAGVKELATNPNAENLKRAKEMILNHYSMAVKGNEFWEHIIERFEMYGIDCYTGYVDNINNLQTQDIKDFINNIILKSGNHAQILMKAEKE